jgi:hypothetical protein
LDLSQILIINKKLKVKMFFPPEQNLIYF